MKFGETVPAGFIVECTSWENDGDNYKTIQSVGKSEVFADVVVALAPLLKSRNGRKGGFGNTAYGEVDSFDFIEAAQEALKDLDREKVKLVLGFDVMEIDVTSEESPEDVDAFNRDLEKTYSRLREFIQEKMTNYSEWYSFRVMSSVKVYYLAEPVVIPSVKEVKSISV